MRFTAALTAGALAIAGLAGASTATAEAEVGPRAGGMVAQPVVTVAPHGDTGSALWDSWYDLEPFGYEEEEYFISGVAEADNGGPDADFTTRIIVARPADDADFSGFTLLEWVNVTAEYENAVDYVESQNYLLREGHAWIHVSAQKAGVDNSGGPYDPKAYDPARYAAIDHPGDQYAHSIYGQIAEAVKHGGSNGVDPMGNLRDTFVIAAGQSQSASRLSQHVMRHDLAQQNIDAYLIHGTSGQPTSSPVPAIHLQAEGDVRDDVQGDPSQNIARWEAAGTAHTDLWISRIITFGIMPRQQGEPKQSPAQRAEVLHAAGNYGEQLDPLTGVCILAGATFPMRHIVSSAIDHLIDWVVDGTPAPNSDKVDKDAGNSIAAGELGNGLGGIRLAPIDHPVGYYATSTCGLGGITIPYTDAQLIAMYGTHANYYDGFAASIAQNVADGWLLEDDVDDLLGRACDSWNRFGELGPVDYCTPWSI